MTFWAPLPPETPERGVDSLAWRALDILAGDLPHLGVAISGGSDSTALLVIAAEWARARGVSIHAATVDHGLRPEAAAEARSVAALCQRLGVPHETATWHPQPGAHVAQADARLARHRLLAAWAKREGLAAIAIGHTSDDRIETFLIRARAGSAWWGLAGLAPRSASPVPEAGELVLLRPLLGLGRDALRHTLEQRGIGWIDDPSNLAPRFERVRMRALAGRLAPDRQWQLIASIDRLAALRAAVAAGARAHLDLARAEGVDVRLPTLAGLAREVRLRLAEALVLAVGAGTTPPRGDRLARLAGALGAETFPALTLGGAWFRPQSPDVIVRAAPPRANRNPATVKVDSSGAAALARARALLADPGLAAIGIPTAPHGR